MNISNFEKIQNAIADATEMAMLTVDYKGVPVSKHSKCSDFCKKIRGSSSYGQLCEKCDSRGGLEAARIQKPYIYLCHMGLLDLAIPIIVNGQYVGAIMAGQVLIKQDNEKNSMDHIIYEENHKEDLFNEKELKELYDKLPLMNMDRVQANAYMIFQISNYIVEEALIKIKLNDMNQRIPLDSLAQNTYSETKVIGSNQVQGVNTGSKDISYSSINNMEDDLVNWNKEEKKLYNDNIILRPALEFIKNNYTKTINLDRMASLCNISPSYFSKLFNKATGHIFANYINKLRIKKAKGILETSDMPIINIALDLGFEDCGYFIKVYKKFEGITPALYRNQYVKKI